MITYGVDPWTALADPTRRDVFSRIAVRPRSVTELADELPVSRPAVSQHLRVLKEAGLVSSRPEGTRRVYSANPGGLETVRAELESFWLAALTNFKNLLDEENKEKDQSHDKHNSR